MLIKKEWGHSLDRQALHGKGARDRDWVVDNRKNEPQEVTDEWKPRSANQIQE